MISMKSEDISLLIFCTAALTLSNRSFLAASRASSQRSRSSLILSNPVCSVSLSSSSSRSWRRMLGCCFRFSASISEQHSSKRCLFSSQLFSTLRHFALTSLRLDRSSRQSSSHSSHASAFSHAPLASVRVSTSLRFLSFSFSNTIVSLRTLAL